MSEKAGEALFGWVHVSDIHFGHGDASHGWDQDLVLDALRSDIAERPAGVRVDAVFVTGDIAFSGAGRSPDEYERARRWLRQVGEAAGVGADRVFLVPGNHDVNRAVDKNEPTGTLVGALRSRGTPQQALDSALADPEKRRLLAGRMERYLDLAKDFGPWPGRSPLPPPEQRLYWTHTLDARGGLRVRLVGLNTSLLAKDDEDFGQLRLGNEQLAAAFAGGRAPEELVLVLSHHPLHRGWLGDDDNADAWVKGRAHAHLSGHVHDAATEDARGGSGGSFVRLTAGAAHNDQLPAWIPASHGYSFGEVTRRGAGEVVLRVHPRAWARPVFVLDTKGVPPVRDGKQPMFAEHPLAITLPGAGAPTGAQGVPQTPKAPAKFEGSGPVKVFLSYAPEDEAMKRRLTKALAMAKRTGLVELSESRSAGEVAPGQADPFLQRAQLVLLLVSDDYLGSDYCFEVEMEAARRRAEAGEAEVMAVLLKPVDLVSRTKDYKRLASGERVTQWIDTLPRLPYARGRDGNNQPTHPNHDGIPITTWGAGEEDAAWTEVAFEIRDRAGELRRP